MQMFQHRDIEYEWTEISPLLGEAAFVFTSSPFKDREKRSWHILSQLLIFYAFTSSYSSVFSNAATT